MKKNMNTVVKIFFIVCALAFLTAAAFGCDEPGYKPEKYINEYGEISVTDLKSKKIKEKAELEALLDKEYTDVNVYYYDNSETFGEPLLVVNEVAESVFNGGLSRQTVRKCDYIFRNDGTVGNNLTKSYASYMDKNAVYSDAEEIYLERTDDGGVKRYALVDGKWEISSSDQPVAFRFPNVEINEFKYVNNAYLIYEQREKVDSADEKTREKQTCVYVRIYNGKIASLEHIVNEYVVNTESGQPDDAAADDDGKERLERTKSRIWMLKYNPDEVKMPTAQS